MIKKIDIQNLGLVDTLELQFEDGFTVITGETGSGKSFFCRGIELATGARAKEKFEGKTIIEMEWDDKIFRRVFANKRSRFFIDDEPFALEEGQNFFAGNIHMHSQHDNLFLHQKNAASILLDSSLADQSICNQFTQDYQAYKISKKNLEVLEKNFETKALQKEFLEFKASKLEKVQFVLSDLQAAEDQLKSGDNSEEKKESIRRVIDILGGEGSSILALLEKSQEALGGYFPDEYETLEKIFAQIPPIIESLEEKTPEDNAHQYQAQQLVDTVEQWRREFEVVSPQDLLHKKDVLAQQLAEIADLESQKNSAERQTQKKKIQAEQSAKKLSKARIEQVPLFTSLIEEKCRFLGMEAVRFSVDLMPIELSILGLESVDFLFSANKNQKLSPLRKVASGGEIARITLALKNFWPQNSTLIFDEIDTGVSGNIAEKMAEEMKSLSEHRQIFSITHLPQIAAKADHHFIVEKTHFKNTTQTTIRKVTGPERVEVIAKMLSGEKVSAEARAAAKKLL